MVTAFTFIGLSVIQSLSCFTDIFGDQEITFSISPQEEENETSGNEEVKEIKEKTDNKETDQLLSAFNLNIPSISREIYLHIPNGFYEVSTPPPEC